MERGHPVRLSAPARTELLRRFFWGELSVLRTLADKDVRAPILAPRTFHLLIKVVN
jgi:hypothetical protein